MDKPGSLGGRRRSRSRAALRLAPYALQATELGSVTLRTFGPKVHLRATREGVKRTL